MVWVSIFRCIFQYDCRNSNLFCYNWISFGWFITCCKKVKFTFTAVLKTFWPQREQSDELLQHYKTAQLVRGKLTGAVDMPRERRIISFSSQLDKSHMGQTSLAVCALFNDLLYPGNGFSIPPSMQLGYSRL